MNSIPSSPWTKQIGKCILATSLTAGLLVPAVASAQTSEVNSEYSPRQQALIAEAERNVSIHFGFRRDEKAADRDLRKVSTPGSKTYRVFPSRKQIRKRYGASRKDINAVRAEVSSAGLDLKMDPTGIFGAISGPADVMSSWLGVEFQGEFLLDGTTLQIGWPSEPPASIRKFVRKGEWVPLDVLADFTELSGAEIPVSKQSEGPKSFAGRNLGTPKGCLKNAPITVPGTKLGFAETSYAYNQLNTAYGIDELPRKKRVGRQTKLAIIAWGSGYSEENLEFSRECFKLPKMSFTRSSVPGLLGALPDGDEGDLDVQVAQSVLPVGTSVDIIEQAPFTADPRTFLAYAAAYRGELPNAVSLSYAICELILGETSPYLATGFQMADSVANRLALAGVSVFAASGDYGSSGCTNFTGDKQKAVGLPSSLSSFIAVGGSRIVLNKDNSRKKEYAWNDEGLQPPIGPQPTAGGGGKSVLVAKPWWQRKAGISGKTRSVPDISAHASLGPGWPLWTGDSGLPTIVSGTSAATPLLAASVATIGGNEIAQGRPTLGLLSPLLYDLGSSSSQIHDIRKGNNDPYDQGCCSAGKGYDRATGLGSLNVGVFGNSLPSPAITTKRANG